MKRRKNKAPKKKSYFKKTILFACIILICITSGSLYVFGFVQKELKKTYVASNNTGKVVHSDKPLTFLFLGIDSGDNERGGAQEWDGNTDSQIILSLNPKTKTTTMVSIQRDTMTNINDENGQTLSTQKLNAAYPIGFSKNGLIGATSYASRTIGEQVGVSIDYFVSINMDGFVNLINDVGGIDVINNSGGDIYISNTEPQYKEVVPFIGYDKSQHINGEQALVFSRDRDHLPNGDYGRSAHQREVLQKLIQKLLKVDALSKYQKILKDLTNNFKTNLSLDTKNLLSLMSYRDCFSKVVSIQYEGLGSMAEDSLGNTASYQFIPNDVYLALQNIFRKSLGKSTTNNVSKNIISYETYFGGAPDSYYLPSATVIENGKSKIFGINTDGNLEDLNEKNVSNYIFAR